MSRFIGEGTGHILARVLAGENAMVARKCQSYASHGRGPWPYTVTSSPSCQVRPDKQPPTQPSRFSSPPLPRQRPSHYLLTGTATKLAGRRRLSCDQEIFCNDLDLLRTTALLAIIGSTTSSRMEDYYRKKTNFPPSSRPLK